MKSINLVTLRTNYVIIIMISQWYETLSKSIINVNKIID